MRDALYRPCCHPLSLFPLREPRAAGGGETLDMVPQPLDLRRGQRPPKAGPQHRGHGAPRRALSAGGEGGVDGEGFRAGARAVGMPPQLGRLRRGRSGEIERSTAGPPPPWSGRVGGRRVCPGAGCDRWRRARVVVAGAPGPPASGVRHRRDRSGGDGSGHRWRGLRDQPCAPAPPGRATERPVRRRSAGRRRCRPRAPRPAPHRAPLRGWGPPPRGRSSWVRPCRKNTAAGCLLPTGGGAGRFPVGAAGGS